MKEGLFKGLYNKIYRGMQKMGDAWDRMIEALSRFTARHGKTVSIVLLIVTGFTAALGRSILPDLVKVELGFDGSGHILTRSEYLLRMTLICIGSNMIFTFWSKRTVWLITSFSAVLAFTALVLSHL